MLTRVHALESHFDFAVEFFIRCLRGICALEGEDLATCGFVHEGAVRELHGFYLAMTPLVEKIAVDRDEDGRARVDITYRFGPSSDESASIVDGVQNSSFSRRDQGPCG
jgi:hypothetical protein